MKNEEKKAQQVVRQYAMILNYNARVEHQYNYINGKEVKEDFEYELADFRFFTSEKFKTMVSQNQLRSLIQKIIPRMDVNTGRDWVIVYIAYHFYVNKLLRMKSYVDFFADIEAMLPDALPKINKAEVKGDKRYRAYTESLAQECDKWFIDDDCLPPSNEWKSMKYNYGVDNTRRLRITKLVTELYQGMKQI